MYLMYVDESGDAGLINSPTGIFILSAIVLHESQWLNILDDLIYFRRTIRARYGLRMKEEIHSSVFITGRPRLTQTISRNLRLDLLKKCLIWLNSRDDISVITVCCQKTGGGDIFNSCWKTLIQRFENTLLHNHFPGGYANEKGIILSDNTNNRKLTLLIREMRRYNLIPHMMSFSPGSRNIRLRAVVEDPVFRDSSNSYFHQMVDVIAYFGRQFYVPNNYVRAKGARTFYNILSSITNPYVTNYSTPNNIVEI